jgi:hypothetical protein
VATDVPRYRLLRSAVIHGPILSTKVAAAVGGGVVPGTARAHAQGLVRAGLLTRTEHPVTYYATGLGRRVYRLVTDGAVLDPAPPSPDLVIGLCPSGALSKLAHPDLLATVAIALGSEAECLRQFRLTVVQQ